MKLQPEKIRFLVIVLIAGLVGYGFGVTKIALDWHNYQPRIEVIGKEPPPSVTTMDFTRFWEILGKLETNYYDRKAINSQNVLNGAISGMVDSLGDPYTIYLPPQQNNNFKQALAGQFEGIGAELGMKGKQIIVVAPLSGSPAEKAGIKPGDAIFKVNGQLISDWSLNKTVDTIRGPKGTKVTLTIVHKDTTVPVTLTLTRDTITTDSVTSWTKSIKDIDAIQKDSVLSQHADDKIVYIRLSEFGDNTNEEWLKITNKIAQSLQADSSIKGIVLDLRNNPGGYLQDAVYVASDFIQDGDVVLQEDREGNRQSFPVTGKGILYNVPLVVLINGGSASASEIVAGSLQDHKRATLVGEKSFGKGTIQNTEDLGDGAGMHITFAKWLTPNGRWVGNGKDGTGLTPDVLVTYDIKDPSHDNQLEKAVEQLVQ